MDQTPGSDSHSSSVASSSSSGVESGGKRKLVNKIKSLRAKRNREKKQKIARREQKATHKVEADRIDKWQREQRAIFETERKQELFVTEAKKSLFEVKKKKKILQDKIMVMSALGKLREVRRKQLINVKPGFSSSQTNVRTLAKSTQDFNSGLSSIQKKVEGALASVVKEESMILFRIQQKSPSKRVSNKGKKGSEDEGKREICPISSSAPDDDAEQRKLKRDRKWQKYLYKKTLKMHYSFGCKS